ncbi:ribonuclease H-like domain-containing protein [Tanacetum coccineum]
MFTVRCLLNLDVLNCWPIYQLDVNSAFLYGDLVETVYMKLPEGYFPTDNNKVCRLKKSLYGLKQAPRKWNAKLTYALVENGFSQSKSDYSLYTKFDKGVFVALLVIDTNKGICINQRKYVLDLLSEYGMLACKPAKTPLQSKLSIPNEANVDDPLLDNITDYQKLMRKLIYLTNTRPDILTLLYVDDIILIASSSFLLQKVITSLHGEFAMTKLGSLNDFLSFSSQQSYAYLFLSQSTYVEEILERAHMKKCNPCRTPMDTESKLGPDGDHVTNPTLYQSLVRALQCILCYVCGTIDHGLQLHVLSTSQLTAWTRHVTLSRSSAEAKYKGVATMVVEIAWEPNLLRELHAPWFTATFVYFDNVNATYLSINPVKH